MLWREHGFGGYRYGPSPDWDHTGKGELRRTHVNLWKSGCGRHDSCGMTHRRRKRRKAEWGPPLRRGARRVRALRLGSATTSALSSAALLKVFSVFLLLLRPLKEGGPHRSSTWRTLDGLVSARSTLRERNHRAQRKCSGSAPTEDHAAFAEPWCPP